MCISEEKVAEVKNPLGQRVLPVPGARIKGGQPREGTEDSRTGYLTVLRPVFFAVYNA